jgi:hypothetical protein
LTLRSRLILPRFLFALTFAVIASMAQFLAPGNWRAALASVTDNSATS